MSIGDVNTPTPLKAVFYFVHETNQERRRYVTYTSMYFLSDVQFYRYKELDEILIGKSVSGVNLICWYVIFFNTTTSVNDSEVVKHRQM